jgi:hypothetical protein
VVVVVEPTVVVVVELVGVVDPVGLVEGVFRARTSCSASSMSEVSIEAWNVAWLLAGTARLLVPCSIRMVSTAWI